MECLSSVCPVQNKKTIYMMTAREVGDFPAYPDVTAIHYSIPYFFGSVNRLLIVGNTKGWRTPEHPTEDPIVSLRCPARKLLIAHYIDWDTDYCNHG